MAFRKKDLNVHDIKKVPIRFDISLLNLLVGYLFKTDSRQITRKALNNLNKLFQIIDENVYTNNDKMEARFYFIKRVLNARLVHGMENEDMIVNFCRTDTYNEEIEDIIRGLPSYKRINFEEIRQLNKIIQDRLDYAYVLNLTPALYNAAEKLDSGEYESFKEINDEIIAICTELIKETRKHKVLEDTDSINFDDENVDDAVMDIANKLKDPSTILQTGIRFLNKILAPGYMSKRLYVYMGLPAGFKSGILLKTARDIKRYNRHIMPKNPRKKKTVLFITMENTVEETVERLFNMTITTEDIRGFTAKQIVKMIKDSGEFLYTDAEDTNIIIKYFPNRSIDTSDLYTIIDDVEDEGYEVIALILDYIKRIRPHEKGVDEKQELKNVTNELKSLAIDKNIPVITAHQLNRAAASTIDAAMQSNKEDLAKFVGRGNVGGAWEVQENSDWCCIINVEQKRSTGQYYLTFKRTKIRYRDPNDLGYFNHPFEISNRIKLIDDIELEEVLSEESLTSDFEGVIDINVAKMNRQAKKREVVEDEDNIFDFGSAINKKKTS